MTADDVRARFEAWFLASDWHGSIDRMVALSAWQAAHADRDAEVRELVEAAESSGDYLDTYFKASNSSQPADWMEAALLAKQWHCRIAAALAKLTQEKP